MAKLTEFDKLAPEVIEALKSEHDMVTAALQGLGGRDLEQVDYVVKVTAKRKKADGVEGAMSVEISSSHAIKTSKIPGRAKFDDGQILFDFTEPGDSDGEELKAV